MGRRSRDKGYRTENQLVHKHRDMGIDAERIPLSGAHGGRFAGDLVIMYGDEPMTAEVKARANGAGFKQLEDWLSDHDLLFLRKDRAEAMVVMPWTTYSKLIRGDK